MKQHIYKTRIRYADVDAMGVVYYANYYFFMEAARTELLRAEGMPYTELETEGLALPVIESRCKYLKPAHYDEEISVIVTIGFIRNSSIKINYLIKRDDTKLVIGHTIHPIINKNWEIIPLPEKIKTVLLPYLVVA